MRSISLLLSSTTLLCVTLQIHAYCDQQTAARCLRQLGLNSSNTNLIPDCNVTVAAECKSIKTACNTTLPANSSYDVLCTATGISFYNSTNLCLNESAILTSAICSQPPRPSINCTTNGSGKKFFTASTVTAMIRSMLNCTTTASGLQLLPNPVGPDAITAIVVLVCLTIIAILAGLFFWPKCHIADPAAEALKRATKPASAKAKTAANSYAVSSPSTSGTAPNKTSSA